MPTGIRSSMRSSRRHCATPPTSTSPRRAWKPRLPQVQGAGATRLPEVTAYALLGEAKQSYDFLVPRQALPQGWNGYGVATLNMSWELDFWGKNRAALAAALSEQRAAEVEIGADAADPVDLGGVRLRRSGASLYAARQRRRDARPCALQTVALFRQRHQFGLETLASVRQVEARQAAAKGELLAIDERIGLQRNAIAALLGAGPDRGLAITRPTVAWAGSQGLPPNLSLDLLGRRPDIVAARLRTEAAAHRIDQRKAGFYPSVNLLAFAGFQSVGIDNLFKSASQSACAGPAISLPIFNTEPPSGTAQGRPRGVRRRRRHLQRDALDGAARGRRRGHEPQVARWGACRRSGGRRRCGRSAPDRDRRDMRERSRPISTSCRRRMC